MVAFSVSDLDRFWKYVHKTDGCWLWTAYRRQDGYGRFFLNGKVRIAPRVAWQIANGPIPDGLHVLHSCDNPACVRPDHLHLGTNADNVRECVLRGRKFVARGELGPSAKLTWKDVDEIRRAVGTTSDALASAYGVSPSAIRMIRRGERWRTRPAGENK